MTRRLNTVLLTTTALAALGLASALAGPDGANVVGGSATIQGQGTATVTINQSSDRAVINWRQFDIGVGESARFNQPSSSSVTLNRVTGGLGPTQILGNLDANGRVFVINRDGILIGPNAKIDTAGFLATTNDIRNDDFMAGRYNFNIPGRPDASIVNQGTITAHSAGFAALVAPGVRNTGTITATLGTVGLASGNGFTLDFYGDRLITLAVGDSIGTTVRDVQTGQPLNSLVENAGRIQANGGRVELTAVEARRVVDSVINNRGVIEANTVGTRGGTIVLGAATQRSASSPRQVVRVGGTLSASAPKGTKSAKIKDGSGEGGRVIVTGEDIVVANARIDVSGPARGGTVLIGGDWAGGNPNTSAVSHPNARLESTAIPTAATVTVDASTVIDASATDNGDAGKVIVWADGATSFRGNILAMGGPNGGNGGFVEVSGHRVLDYRGTVDTRAPRGTTGTLLLDPYNVTITTNPSVSPGTFDSNGVWTPTDNGSNINNVDLQNQLALSNVVITTNGPGLEAGNITFSGMPMTVTWSSSNSLTLSAHNNVTFGDGVTVSNTGGTGGGSFIVRADSDGDGNGTINFVQATFGSRVTWTGSTGNVSFYYNPTSYSTPTDFTPAGQIGGGDRGVTTANANQFTPYMLVNSGANLQSISSNLGGTYALGTNVNAGVGFNGFASGTTFTGTLDGHGGLGTNHTIQNLTLTSTQSSDAVGLFPFLGTTGIVRNLNLTGVNITAGHNTLQIGAVAGMSDGTVSNVNVSGSITNPNNFGGIIAGGLVGQNTSNNSIINSTSSVNVNVGNASSGSMMNTAGGVVGTNIGTVSNSSASGPVSGGNNTFIGGLVGNNSGSILTSSASGAVTITSNSGDTSSAAGGMVGANSGTIANSTASGNVTGQATSGPNVILGGFVGLNGLTGSGPPTGNITESQATGNVSVTGNGQIGGFAGGNFASITFSSATGQVSTEQGMAGGFVGFNSVEGSIANAEAAGTNSVTSQGSAGGFVGENMGEIANASSTRPVVVSTPTFADLIAGGFAARNTGNITNSTASGSVTATGDIVTVGGFVGENSGLINNGSASGSVVSTAAFGSVGGFAGFNEEQGQILNSSATGSVTANGPINFAGGFAGANFGLINESTASGNVNATTPDSLAILGGFAGLNAGLMQHTTASGNVTGGDTSFVGGLVGFNLLGGITESSASGAVTGGNNSIAGGLVAINLGAIGTSFSTGTVTGGANSVLGGLVAINVGVDFDAVSGPAPPAIVDLADVGTIRQSYSLSPVTGGANSVVAGLVAANGGLIDQTYAAGFVQAGSNSTLGGLIAVNNASFTVPGVIPGGDQFPTQPGTVTNSYWDPGATGLQASAAGTVFPTAPGLPPGFDANVWVVQTGTFPCLPGQSCTPRVLPPPPPPPTPDLPQLPPPNQNPLDDLIRSLLPPSNSLVVANLTQQTTTGQQPADTSTLIVQTTTTAQTTQNQPRGNQRPQGNQNANGPLRPDGRPSNVPPLNETRFINDQVVVQIGAGVSPDVLNRVARRLGLSIMASETLGLLGTRVIQFQIGSGRSVREVILELEKQKIVNDVTPNYQFELTQNTTTAAPAGDAAQYTIAKLNLVEAHRIATGENVLIAVIDSEIDAKHPDLEGRIANRFDAVGPADKPHPHGTGMAGAIASHRKLMGTAPGARILAIRAFGSGSGGAQGTTMQIVKGLDWAISQGAKVVNMSFAGPKDPTLAKAFAAAAAKKVVLIAAAGNAGPKSPPLFPGAETGVIAVSATDADDAVYVNANRGKYVTVAAPGVDILVPAPDGNYEFTTGTSVAAAHVSGVAALLLQRDPKLDPATVREILTSTAKQLGKTQGGRNDETGHGLVDPLKALQSLGARSAGVTAPATVGVAAR